MIGTGFLRLKKLKGPGIVAAAARHNRRTLQAEVGAAPSIDPTRSRLNQTLQGPPTPEAVALLARERLRDAGIGKLRKDAVMALELVFSLPPSHTLGELDQRYFADCSAWAGRHFGGDPNILTVDIHRDEAAPHCHVLLLPLIDGRMVGSALMGDRRKLLQLQQDFHQAVAGRYGLRKAPNRLAGTSKRRAASAVLEHLARSSDAALRSKVWPSVRDAIEGHPAPYLAALGITLEPTIKERRTMTQIFTSTGRGGKTEKPIGFDRPSKAQTLCPVGFRPSTPPAALPDRQPEVARQELVRVRDDELDPAQFDPETGEFNKPQPEPLRRHRADATTWVDTALAARRG